MEIKASVRFKADVTDYWLTYYTPNFATKETDILAAFWMNPQPGVSTEEAGAAGWNYAMGVMILCLYS